MFSPRLGIGLPPPLQKQVYVQNELKLKCIILYMYDIIIMGVNYMYMHVACIQKLAKNTKIEISL